MQIDVYLSPGCESLHQLGENMAEALAETGVAAEVNVHEVDETRAAELGLHGSPTVWIDGKDIASGGTPGLT